MDACRPRAAGFTYTLSPTLLVDGNVGYTRQNIGANGDVQNGLYGLNTLKIPGTNGVGPNYYGVPGFQVTGVANMGNTNTGSPFQFRDNQYTTAINLSKTKGAHNLRFGFEYDKYALNHFQPQGGTFGTARGTFGFDGTLTALKGGAAVNFNGVPANSWAQFLLGYPSRIGKITQFQNPNALRFSDWAMYARDQWQVTRNLTVNYGMRWEYYPIFAHNWYGAVRYDPSTYTVLIGGEGSTPWDTGASASKKGFAPRLGLAYRLGSKTVIRTGYGITIDPDNMRNQRNAFPAVLNQDFTPANSYMFVTTPGVAQASLRTGIPAGTAPDISGGKITPSTVASPTTYLPTTSIAASFPQYMNRGYIQSWNFFVQREFSPTSDGGSGIRGHARRPPDDGSQHQWLGPQHGKCGQAARSLPDHRLESVSALRQPDLRRVADQREEAVRPRRSSASPTRSPGPSTTTTATTATARCSAPIRCRMPSTSSWRASTASTHSSSITSTSCRSGTGTNFSTTA